MICGNCGAANDPGHKFCFECGTALSAVCPSCGHANGPGHKFCSECGHDLTNLAALAPTAMPTTETPASEPGERRFVSVLFADLVGSPASANPATQKTFGPCSPAISTGPERPSNALAERWTSSSATPSPRSGAPNRRRRTTPSGRCEPPWS
ncbi:MAG: zinc ribbon domain-containing protein [Acidobacteria bacterium]|nr:zinc ribbon domain-containing protein [Acidobacteriota bacterium]